MADAGSVSSADTTQTRLLKRYWIAAGGSFLVLLFMFALYWDGYLKETGFYYTAAGILFCVVLYYALFRSGLNLKARDPSVTIAQILSAIVVLTIAMYCTSSSARSVILPIVLINGCCLNLKEESFQECASAFIEAGLLSKFCDVYFAPPRKEARKRQVTIREYVITDNGVVVIDPRRTVYDGLITGIPQRSGPRKAQESEAAPEPKATK